MSNAILNVIGKLCSDLTLLCIDNQHLILKYHAVVFTPASCGRMDEQSHLLLHTCVESHSSINLCPVHYLKAYLCLLNSLGRRWMDFTRPLHSWVTIDST